MREALFKKDFKAINYNDINFLVQNQIPESDKLEYKAGLPPKWVLAKIMVAFANTSGGYIIMGIAEVRGKLIIEGVTAYLDYKLNLHDTLFFFSHQINYDVHIVNIPERPENVLVLIKIEKSSLPIAFFDKEQKKSYYIRVSNKILPIKDKKELSIINQSPVKEKLFRMIANGESEQIEFKATYKWDIDENRVNKNLTHEISKEICAFQNSRGGTLFIGVKDNCDLYGLKKDIKLFGDLDKLQQDIPATVRRDLGGGGMDFEMSIEKIQSKQICIIEVDRTKYPVFYQNNYFYIRRGTSCHSLNPKETYDYIINHFETS